MSSIGAGKLKILAVTSYETLTPAVPVGTPARIVKTLNKEVRKVLSRSEVRATMYESGTSR